MPWSFTHICHVRVLLLISHLGWQPSGLPTPLRNRHWANGLPGHFTERAREGGSPGKLLSGRKSKISAYLLLRDAEVALSLAGWGGTALLREAREHRLHYGPHGHAGKLKLMQSTLLIKANWHASEITLPCSWGKPDSVVKPPPLRRWAHSATVHSSLGLGWGKDDQMLV